MALDDIEETTEPTIKAPAISKFNTDGLAEKLRKRTETTPQTSPKAIAVSPPPSERIHKTPAETQKTVPRDLMNLNAFIDLKVSAYRENLILETQRKINAIIGIAEDQPERKQKKKFSRIGLIALVALILIAALLVATAIIGSGSLFFASPLRLQGNIVSAGVGVYSDAACTQGLISVDWGMVRPATNYTQTMYLKNIGNSPIALSLIVQNWNPVNASQVLSIGWNLPANTTLQAGAIIPAQLTLSAAPDTGNIIAFDVKIIVNGSA